MIKDFLDYLRYEKNRSERTVETYRTSLRLFESFACDLVDSFSWASVDRDLIRLWMEHLVDADSKSATVNLRLSALRTFYRFLLLRGVVKTDPTSFIKGPKQEKSLPTFVRTEDMDTLLDDVTFEASYRGLLCRTVLLTFYSTGMRLAELIELKDKDVNLEEKQLKVLGKRNKERMIPLGNEICEALLSYREQRNALFGAENTCFFLGRRGKKLSRGWVRLMVHNELARVSTLKKLSPHVLRHSFATAMLNGDSDLESLKLLLGHANLAATEIYTHTTFEQLKRVYKHAHPRA